MQIVLGEQSANLSNAQILVTTPGQLKQRITARGNAIDLSSLKMLVYDEADELFNQEKTCQDFEVIAKNLQKNGVKY